MLEGGDLSFNNNYIV